MSYSRVLAKTAGNTAELALKNLDKMVARLSKMADDAAANAAKAAQKAAMKGATAAQKSIANSLDEAAKYAAKRYNLAFKQADSVKKMPDNLKKLSKENEDTLAKNIGKKTGMSNTTILAGLAAAGVAAYGVVIFARAIERFLKDQTQLTLVTMKIPDKDKPTSTEITYTPEFDFSNGDTISIIGNSDILPASLDSWHSYFKIDKIVSSTLINVTIPNLESPATKGIILTHTDWERSVEGAANETNEDFTQGMENIFDKLKDLLGPLFIWIIIGLCLIIGLPLLIFLVKLIISKFFRS
jgi:hypothetical protein